MLGSISDKLREYYLDECEIKTYTDGASLLSDFNRNCFDVLFLDIDTPVLNGMEIAEKIREFDRRVKIIFISKRNSIGSLCHEETYCEYKGEKIKPTVIKSENELMNKGNQRITHCQFDLSKQKYHPSRFRLVVSSRLQKLGKK